MSFPDYERISADAESVGLRARGAFLVADGDDVPVLAPDRPARSLVMLGNAGAGFWDHFSGSPEFSDGERDPLNRWSARVVGEMAARYRALPLFPSQGPPFLPFVRWAKRAEPVAESPLGMLIHPDYGLWHAWRGALAFGEPVEPPVPDRRPRPCDDCEGQPCLSACPVGAFSGASYDLAACAAHIVSDSGRACMDGGCAARNACPVGPAYRYPPDQVRFHMQAFRRARMSTQVGSRVE
jgi:hypothetical protein